MKNILYLFLLMVAAAGITSCDELTFGNEFLGDAPEREGATLDTMFSSQVRADQVLTTAYAALTYPLVSGTRMGGDVLESLTDLNYTFRTNQYYSGTMNASANGYSGGGNWKVIRYCWLYLENVDRVPNMSDVQKKERKAEAKALMAIAYSEMLRNLGGVPWIDHAVKVTETMKFPRETFAGTMDRIIRLLEEAIPDLNWKQSVAEEGRITKAGAMGLKLRMLLFAASPTFNSDTKWHAQADAYTCYGNYDKGRWEQAKKAGEDFMRELVANGYYDLVQPEGNTHMARRLAFRKGYYERATGETLISIQQGYSEDFHLGYMGGRYYLGPTLNYVDMFPWADGSDFPSDFNWTSPFKQPFYEKDGTATRDPRLYETAAVPGEKYANGTYAPVYWGHDAYRKGVCTGFMMMKFILTEDADRASKPVQWPYLRLPEVLLSYAEAINEFDGTPNNTAYECVNRVRRRVGLSELPKGMGKEQFRAAVLKERALEFGQEEVRWYDLVRWGMTDVFKEKLYFLNSYIKEMNGSAPSAFKFEKAELTDRYWRTNWDSKWYMMPLPQSEINKDYGWTQNPGW